MAGETSVAPAHPLAGAPRLSVLMSVYNGRPHLAAAVDSILAQTFAGFEFLIVDDGSTDGSGEMLESYARRDPRIRLFRRENRGLARSLNELIAESRGVYLARMDADDVSRPERFARQVARLDAEPGIDVLGGFARFIDEGTRPIIDTQAPTGHDEIDACNLVGRTALVHPTVVMRRAAVEAVGGYDPAYDGAEDLDLWLRMAERGRLANLDALVLDYRMLGTSVSGSKRSEQAVLTERTCRAAWQRRGLRDQRMQFAHWRPGLDRRSRLAFVLQWAWQAWGAGNQDTARHYFFKAVRVNPGSMAAWNGLVFGAFRPRARQTGVQSDDGKRGFDGWGSPPGLGADVGLQRALASGRGG